NAQRSTNDGAVDQLRTEHTNAASHRPHFAHCDQWLGARNGLTRWFDEHLTYMGQLVEKSQQVSNARTRRLRFIRNASIAAVLLIAATIGVIFAIMAIQEQARQDRA